MRFGRSPWGVIAHVVPGIPGIGVAGWHPPYGSP